MSSITQQLAEARIGIENTLSNPDIEKQLALVGYSRKKVLEGKTLYVNALQLQEDLEEKYGEQHGATKSFNQDLDAANVLYRRHRKLAKIAYENDRRKITVLKLRLPVPHSIEKWLLQANNFYSVLGKDTHMVEQFGIFTEELAQAQAMTEALLEARNWQVSTKGFAKNATKQRNEALASLNAWMKEFRLAARYALREDKELLKALGIIASARAEEADTTPPAS
jgi:hypothetical protein